MLYIVLTEGVNISCTPPEVNFKADAPNVLITPSQTVTMMDDSSSEDRYPTTVWVVLSLVGLLLFLAIFAVVGIMIFLIHKKTKREKLAEFAKSRSALLNFLLFCCECNDETVFSEEIDFEMATRHISIGMQMY